MCNSLYALRQVEARTSYGDRIGRASRDMVFQTIFAVTAAQGSLTVMMNRFSVERELSTRFTTKGRRLTREMHSTGFIHVLVRKNPKTPGTKSYRRFDLYREGMHTSDFLKAGGLPIDLEWDVHKHRVWGSSERSRFIEILPEATLMRERSASLEEDGVIFDPTNIEDGRKRILQEVVRRQGQRNFRVALFKAYGKQCAVTGCEVPEVLEAAHIAPYKGIKTNQVSNGILLRADIHTLFDLHLIAIDTSKYTVVISRSLYRSPYFEFKGKPILMPKAQSTRPSKEALDSHRKEAAL
jgi:hypothetical protein